LSISSLFSLSHCQQTSLFLPPPNRTEQGKRSDLHQALDHLKEGISMTDLIEQMPGTVSRAYKMLGDYPQEIRQRTAKEQVLADCDDVEWREWQQEITDLTKTQPDGRTIHWYLESEGNTGKTFLRRYLQTTASLPLFLPTFSTLDDHPSTTPHSLSLSLSLSLQRTPSDLNNPNLLALRGRTSSVHLVNRFLL